MLDSVCPLAFRHKKGEYFVGFLFSGGVYLFLVGACGVLDCILVLHFVLNIFSFYHVFDGIFMLGGVFMFCWYFICFLFQTAY